MIHMENLSFSYSGTEDACVKKVNLHIRSGEVVLLCGESGCGKTTLTRLMNGLIPHYYEGEYSGKVTVGGEEVQHTALYDMADTVGSVFQNPRSQFFNVDTDSELAFGCENLGMDEGKILKRIEETTQSLSLETLRHRNIFCLSGGEKQKIACGSVSVLQPRVVVLDEPTSNLDAEGIRDLRRVLLKWKTMGKTIVIAEHRLHFLNGIADRVLYMQDGEIRKEYQGEDFYSQSAEFFEKRGLRIPALSVLRGKETASFENRSTVRLSGFAHSYDGKQEVLKIEEANLPMGCVMAVIGHNGAGKTTLARSLCGLTKKDKSIVEYDGKMLTARNRLKHCYLVMQDVNHQLFTESLEDEILLSTKEEDMTRADDILSDLDLFDIKDRHPMSLSGGQKQRTAVATALASGREIIIFDEPTSGLDYRHMKAVAGHIKMLQEKCALVLVVTHDPELILSCCTHVLHIEKGKLREQYSLDAEGCEKMIDYFRLTMEEVRNGII